MNTGWIKSYRKLLEWEWFTEPRTLQVFLWCLLKANHEERDWRGMTILPGQFITGREMACRELKCTPQVYRTSIERLKSTSEITSKSTNRYSLITVTNWSKYQNDNQQNNQQSNQRITNKQPTNNHKQELKNYKKERIKEDTSPIIIQLTKNLIAGIANCNSPFKDRYEGDQKKIDDLCNKWSSDLGKLIRLDKAKPEDVQAIINWLYQSEGRDALFWRKNILSAGKLREQYLRLVAAAQNEKQQGPRMVIIS